MAYVYEHIRLDKNEIFYIGIGNDDNYKRAYQKKSRNQYWKNIVNISKYDVIISFDNLSWENACKKEIELIKTGSGAVSDASGRVKNTDLVNCNILLEDHKTSAYIEVAIFPGRPECDVIIGMDILQHSKFTYDKGTFNLDIDLIK